MKHYTYLEFTNFIYIRLNGLIWVHNGLINPNNLDKDSGDAIKVICEEVGGNKPLLIDCKGVNNIIDHSWDLFFKELELKKREAIFYNSSGLTQYINKSSKEFCTSLIIKDDNKGVICIYDDEIKLKFNKKVIEEINLKIISNIKSYVRESFSIFKNNEFKYLKSTPILASGEFDSTLIISNPEYFYWTAITLSDLVGSLIEENQVGTFKNKPRILSVSLRSSPFANIIGLFQNCYLETIDHFGPINKFFEINNLDNSGVEYIYIGDFVFGGTELKIARNFALWNNAKLDYAVCIGSLFDTNIYSDITLKRLVSLDNKLHSKAEYKLFHNE
jgi:hypothetical protein